MFDSICFREQAASGTSGPIDLGFLAEALLFYQEVRVVGSASILRQLVPACGAEALIELVERGRLKIGYLESVGGIASGGSEERHTPVSITSPVLRLQNEAPKAFIKATGHSGRGRRLAERFCRFVEVIPYEQSTLDAVRSDMSSVIGLEQSFREILRVLAPDYEPPSVLIADLTEANGQVRLKTNIDFVRANVSYHKRIPPSHSSLTEGYMLMLVLNSRENLQFASKYSSEIATNEATAALLRLKVDSLVKSHLKSLDGVYSFQDFVFGEGKAVREAINRGERTFADLLKLLDKAEKFKEWLKNKKPDANLCREYHHAATSETWINKLATKTVRWVVVTGLGAGIDALGAGGIGTVSGIGLSAADAFLLDRLVKGWQPNHFVDGPLNDFVRNQEGRGANAKE